MYVCFYCMFPLFLIVSCIFFHYSVLRVRFYNKINKFRNVCFIIIYLFISNIKVIILCVCVDNTQAVLLFANEANQLVTDALTELTEVGILRVCQLGKVGYITCRVCLSVSVLTG